MRKRRRRMNMERGGMKKEKRMNGGGSEEDKRMDHDEVQMEKLGRREVDRKNVRREPVGCGRA